MTTIEYAEHFIGKPYVWGGEGADGFDCSGFVIECLQAFGEIPNGDWTAHGLKTLLTKHGYLPVGSIQPGDVLFFGTKDKIVHVAIAYNCYQMIEAGGGNKDSKNKGIVRLRLVNNRNDLIYILRK